MGGLIVLMALTLVFLSQSFLTSSYGFQSSERAKAVAASGVYDAMLRLTRNKDLSESYSMPLGSYSASITVTQDTPGSGFVTIVSTSTVSNFFPEGECHRFEVLEYRPDNPSFVAIYAIAHHGKITILYQQDPVGAPYYVDHRRS